jgi:hypothetical protein
MFSICPFGSKNVGDIRSRKNILGVLEKSRRKEGRKRRKRRDTINRRKGRKGGKKEGKK